MPKRRKEGNKFTTISVSWIDKEKLRRLALFKKETKNGKLYESDAEIFHRLLVTYALKHGIDGDSHSTYPTILPSERQQD